MKNCLRMVSMMLSVLAVVAGVDVAFAQKRQVAKYLAEETKAAKKVKIPAVVNPKISLQAQQRVVQFSDFLTQETLRQSAAATTTLPQSTLSAMGRTILPAGMISSVPGLDVSPAPGPTVPSYLQSEFLTGPQALEAFRPGWKGELLLAGFNEAELDAIAETFAETDEFLFELDTNGNWVKPLSNDWEYSRWFSLILTDKVRLNDGQIKTLFGKFLRLDAVFTRLNLQAFWLVNGRAPKPGAAGEEGKLARHVKYNLNKRDGRKMNPEVEGYVYGDRQVVAQTAPVRLSTLAPSYGPKGRYALRRTPEQVWEEVTQFMREHNGEIPSRTADDYERKLRIAWDNIYYTKQGSNDPYVQRLIELHDENVKQFKTSQEILDYMTAYMREHNGKLPSQNSKNGVEKSNRLALNSLHQKYKDLPDEQVEALPEPERTLEQLFRQEVKQFKTSQEILDYMTAYMPKHNGKLPAAASKDPVEKSNRLALNSFHQKYKDLTDEQVEALPEPDRSLEKLFRQNVREKAANKTPQEILDYMRAYMPEHNGKFPSQYSKDLVEKSYCRALYSFHQKYKDLTEEQVEALPEPDRTLEKLFRQEVKQYKTPQEILDYTLQYMRDHDGKLPSEYSKDLVEKSNRMALNTFHQKYKDLTDEQVEALPESERTLEKLYRNNVRKYNRKEAE